MQSRDRLARESLHPRGIEASAIWPNPDDREWKLRSCSPDLS